MSVAHELIAAPEKKPDRWMIFLHGILGTRGNWRSFARKFVAARPDWGAILVDLRKHGESVDFDPPHTVAAASRDLDALGARAILGHSFGGKVALDWSARHSPEVVFIIDSTPSARPELVGSDYGAYAIARVLERAPARASKRSDYFDFMVREGLDKETSQWLAMNVKQADGQFELRIDLPAIRALLDDYFARDLWSALDDRVHVVIGTRGSVPGEDRARMRSTRARVHELEAGHWVHVDRPDELLALVARTVP